MERPENCIIVIFGASGDLTKRKLVPALFNLYHQKLLPEQFAILGVSRSSLSDDPFRERMTENIQLFAEEKPVNESDLKNFAKNLFYQSIDTSQAKDYEQVKSRLDELDKTFQIGGNYIYYLSTPPHLYEPITANLGQCGLNAQSAGASLKRIIIEKPFGRDLQSARVLNKHLQSIFQEEQIYRIDHYLGKETVQNILAFRFANVIFEPIWNRDFIDRVEVTNAEHIGIEDRGGYYDQAGALRDMVQNHLLQVLGTVAMEPPSFFNADAVRNEAVQVFESLRPISIDEIEKCVVRGQYMESTIRGEKIPGYRQEKNVAADSRTETFLAMKFFIDNWRWGGVPFYIRTGKRLPTRVTEVVIHFKRTPHHLFAREDQDGISYNQLIIRIQPDEGILLKFGMKAPGSSFQIKTVDMDFHYSDLGDAHLPSAYEHLLLDCMQGDATLYARSDAVEATWEFVDPILKAWENHPEIKMFGYPAGTWGPRESKNLFDDPSSDWRYPCRDLSKDGTYCEL